jgi:hypothetical protein
MWYISNIFKYIKGKRMHYILSDLLDYNEILGKTLKLEMSSFNVFIDIIFDQLKEIIVEIIELFTTSIN